MDCPRWQSLGEGLRRGVIRLQKALFSRKSLTHKGLTDPSAEINVENYVERGGS